MQQRKIIHIDMDAFFASVEQRDTPAYRGRPLVVGGDPGGRGVVAACSYEARRFGVRSAMPCARAARLCPDAIFVRPRFDAYKAVSREIQSVFRAHTDRVEPLSLDEAFLDVSESRQQRGSATRIALAIKREILAATGLTASAGVSYNKFLAKIASDMDKPDGLYVIRPEQGAEFVASLPIGRFFGVGKVTESRMLALGIRTGADLRRWSLADLQREFGKSAGYYFRVARGRDDRPVQTERTRKSISVETTFASDLRGPDPLHAALAELCERLAAGLQRHALSGRTLVLKVRFADFTTVTRSHSQAAGLAEAGALLRIATALLARTRAATRPVRLLGVGMSGLLPDTGDAVVQLEIPGLDPTQATQAG